jgi:nucleoside-diphosphate-sugar epimerase
MPRRWGRTRLGWARAEEPIVRVLATGTEGYVGTILAPFLLERGHDVVGVDTGFYASGALYADEPLEAAAYEEVREDIRRLRPEHFEGVDTVVHLAELSNDPLGQLLPDVTREVNHRGSVRVASLAKAAGVRRFVYASSCSVYGIAEEDVVTEENAVNPQTAYAVCKSLVERDVGALANDEFSPTFLRFATAFGISPRMRFDIVLNNLCGLAWTTREIKMESDGTPWRPLVHVLDMCEAIVCAIEAPRERVHNEILNAGAPNANYRIRDLAAIVGEVFEGCRISVGTTSPDTRSYRVSFEKIRELLPEFRCDWSVHAGSEQLLDVFRRIGLTGEEFQSRHFTRLKQMEHLLRTGAIDRSLFWTSRTLPGAPQG